VLNEAELATPAAAFANKTNDESSRGISISLLLKERTSLSQELFHNQQKAV
jgi:hypothetical protein